MVPASSRQLPIESVICSLVEFRRSSVTMAKSPLAFGRQKPGRAFRCVDVVKQEVALPPDQIELACEDFGTVLRGRRFSRCQ